MRKVLIAMAASVVSMHMASAAGSSPRIEQEIDRLERACNAAYAANDLAKYFACYDDSASLVFYNERTTIPAYRTMWTESIKKEPIESVTISDMNIRALGEDTAVASYQLVVKTHHPGSASTEEHAFETDVWSKVGGTWKITHVHFSAISP